MACADCPRRYLVVFLGFIGLLLSIGYRQAFALVMVHVKFSNDTQRDQESVFPQCTTTNTTNNLELDISGETVFLMHTAYFCGSILTQVPGGILAARFSSKLVCGICIFISSILFIALPFALKFHYGLVFLIRAVQGVVEGGSVPALNGVISAWAPKLERARLIAVAYAGAYISPAVALLATGATSCYVSWNAIFFIYGGCGILWFFLWLVLVHETPASHPSLSEKERDLFKNEGHRVHVGSRHVMAKIPWRYILTSLPVYAIFVGAFCRNWIFAMLIMEEPQYFKDVYNMHTADIGLLSAVPYCLMTIVVIFGGIVVDKLIKNDILSTTTARKLAESLGFGVEASCVLALAFIDSWKIAFILLCVGVGISGFAISGYQVNPLDLAPQYAGVVTGLARLGTIGAILSTIVASQLTGTSKASDNILRNWQHLFLAAAVIHFLGVVFYAIFASGNKQGWAEGGSTLTVIYGDPTGTEIDETAGINVRQRLLHRTAGNDGDVRKYGSTMRYLNTI